jgi:hypothetical protein
VDEDSKNLIELNQANLDRVIGFVGVMDGKAKFALTLVLALTSYLVTQLSSFIDAHTRINTMPPWSEMLMILLDVAAAVCLIFFVIAAVLAIRAINPSTVRHSGKSSPLFFDTIAKMSHEDFKQQMKMLTVEEMVELLADQTYDNAKIVQKKTKFVQYSAVAFYLGLASFFIFTVGRTIIIGVFPVSSLH